jgi:hypothetical protein
VTGSRTLEILGVLTCLMALSTCGGDDIEDRASGPPISEEPAAAPQDMQRVTSPELPQQPAEDALGEFQARIQEYLAVRQQATRSVPPIPSTVGDPAIIVQYQQDLARAIRALRPDAQRGDVFTRKVRTLIANVINSKTGESARMAILGAGNPRSAESPATISLAVNATYPSSAPLSTMPFSLLAELPKLPMELEFRFVGHALILRDREASLVVDIMTDAI